MTTPVPHTPWRRSPSCGNGACVEVAKVADRYLVRDSKNPDTVLEFTSAEWAAFALAVKADHFE